MDAFQIVKKSVGPAIATDKKGRILSWNGAAADLLDYTRENSLKGELLHTALDTKDVFGNRVDFSQVPFQQMVVRGEPVNGFEIAVRKRGGDFMRLLVSVVVVLGPKKSDCNLVYLFRPVYRRRKADEVIERVLANPSNGRHVLDRSGEAKEKQVPDLTRRQTEVLRLLAQGCNNEEIAKRLFLSVFTVRSHVQSTLDKLGVHSKVEAVSRAFRDHLI